MEIVCDPIQQFFETNPLVSMHTIVGLKGLRIKTMDPLVFISFSDTIIEVSRSVRFFKQICIINVSFYCIYSWILRAISRKRSKLGWRRKKKVLSFF